MSFLNDTEIAALLSGVNSISPDLSQASSTEKDSPVQACTLDLAIGDIFVPGARRGELGSVSRPRSFLALEQGHSALVRTTESIRLPPDMGAIAFPPARVSMNGLLMTNPGHVDPGYEGKIHLTVINMGKEQYQLSRGDRIVRLLLFKMKSASTTPFNVRAGLPVGGKSPVSEDLMDRLTKDFVDVTKRSETAADKVLVKAQLRAALLTPILAGIFGALATIAVTSFTQQGTDQKIGQIETQISRLDARVGGLGGQVNLDSIERRLRAIEEVERRRVR